MTTGVRSNISEKHKNTIVGNTIGRFLTEGCFLSLLFVHSIAIGQGFTEIGNSLGIDHIFTTEEYGGGVSFVDFNQDGLDDLTYATENGSKIKFHINTGSAYQEIEALVNIESEVKQVLWIDFNNDGALDLYVSSVEQNRLFKNTGNLILQDITATCGFNDPELISYASTWMDYDQDGLLDLFVAHRTPEETGFLTLYHNIGNDQFEDLTIKAGLKSKGNSVLAMTSLDYNNDGWTDLFLAQDWDQGNQLFKNLGNGIFKDVSSISNTNLKMNSMTATIGDYNADGWMDIYISNTNEGNKLLRNNGDETFSEVAEEMNVNRRSITFGSGFFDADNDGDLDLQIVGLNVNYLYENVGIDLPFQRVDGTWITQSDGQANNGLAFGDFNSDGFIDFTRNAISREGSNDNVNTFFRNDFSDNNYLVVDLEGVVSNRNAIGTRLHLHIGNSKQIRRVAVAESFASQHSYSQFFGLEKASVVDSLVVMWPSGNKTIVKNISANQHLDIREPESGCTDLDACNYNSGAIEDNGSCRYVEEYMDCLGCLKDEDEDGVCDELEILGCTDINSCNYSPLATESDGSCWYLPTFSIIGESEVDPIQLMEYVYENEDLASSYNWSISNGSIVLGQGTPKVQVLWHDQLTGMISLTETDENNCTSPLVTMSVLINSIILSTDQRNDFSFYPNPANQKIFFDLKIPGDIELTMVDVSGKVVKKELIIEGTQNWINTGPLEEGIYFIHFISAHRNSTKKIVIKH